MYNIPDNVRERFINLDGLVEADNVHILYYMKIMKENHRSWDDERVGVCLTVAHVNINGKKMPIVIQMFFSVINGKRLCFWHASSCVVDYDVVDAWFEKNLPGIRRTDANNFYSMFDN